MLPAIYEYGRGPLRQADPNDVWMRMKAEEYKPKNVLRGHSTINWFRTRQSKETKETYLHTGEELSSKQIVKSVVKDMRVLKDMKI